MNGATLSTPPSTGLSGIQISNTPNYNTLDELERPEDIENCTKDEVDTWSLEVQFGSILSLGFLGMIV